MKYRAITNENFYYYELKNASRFICKYPEIEDIKKAFREEDILDSVSENNYRRKFISINKRLKFLTNDLMYYLIEGDSNTGKFINLYSILCCERIILEFMDEVVKEKYKIYDYHVKESDFTKFIEMKAEQSEIVENWSTPGKKKVIVKVKNFLIESGFLYKEEDGRYKIVKPIVLLEVIDEIKENGNRSVLKAMLY